jgi:hypothetical protein
MAVQVDVPRLCSQPTERSSPWVGPPAFCSQEALQPANRSSQLTQSTEELSPTQPYEVEESSHSDEEEGDGYLLPEVRFPRISPNHDTAFIEKDFTLISVHGSNELFIEEKFVVKKHPMKFIDCGRFPAGREIVAITREGKHVVWQQAIRSCFPTAVSMIALDCGKRFLADELFYAVTNNEVALEYIRKAGFEPIIHPLKGNIVEKVRALEEIIARTGPGLLSLIHPDLQSHVVVVDAISVEKWRATLRDPYHGYMITVRLFPLMEWISDQFYELAELPLKRKEFTDDQATSLALKKKKTD